MQRSTPTSPAGRHRGVARHVALAAALLGAGLAGYVAGASVREPPPPPRPAAPATTESGGRAAPWPAVWACAAAAATRPQRPSPAPEGAPPGGDELGTAPSSEPLAAAATRPGPEVVARVEGDVLGDLDRMKPGILARCWPEAPTPGAARFELDLLFDAEGRELLRGFRQEGAPGDVVDCVRREIGAFQIAWPGVEVSVQATLTLP